MASGPGSSMQKLSARRKRSSRDPAALLDEHAVHQGDLAGGPAEGQDADLRPDGESFAEGWDLGDGAQLGSHGGARPQRRAARAPA